MQKIVINAVGNLKESYLKDAVNEYSKRLSKFVNLSINEVQEYNFTSQINIENIINSESESLKRISSDYIIALDLTGKEYSSVDFAKHLDKLSTNGISKITFLIGGSNGLSRSLVKECNETISFGKMTYPHQLMRVILLEQLYRAETILHNISYHK